MKTGVFGGTFDPIHNGHLAIAEEVRSQVDLQEIWFMPAGQPWLKAERPISPAAQRVQMVELAIAGKPYFKLSLVEVTRPGPSYTIDTILELRKQLKKAELYFILGWDSLLSLPLWKDALRLITLCRLVAIPRPGIDLPDLTVLEQSIPGITQKVIMLEKPNLDISATEIREKAAAGKPIGKLVPKSVADYIKKNKLYR
ncbi:MAG: nicotinate-nucleotide adenylyltransferase [Dehalococcoidales bacterium]|nr:nicotinate-nucleotide adenylyltransferase [Dehalococcoidales bacterium]